jgi:hypothetical protein
MKYYCLHHSPATERKQYALNFFHKHNIDAEWIEDFLPDSETVINYPKVYSVHAANRSSSLLLNNAELSLTLKHVLAIDRIRTINDYAIIFEDDIKDVNFNFEKVVSKFVDLVEKQNVDILWIGSSDNHMCNLSPSTEPKIVIHKNAKARLTHCYMINSNTANKVYNEFSNIKHPPDWQWNYVIDKLNLTSAWSYPHIYQRTDTNETPSLLR